jgi:hypothetical protein
MYTPSIDFFMGAMETQKTQYGYVDYEDRRGDVVRAAPVAPSTPSTPSPPAT